MKGETYLSPQPEKKSDPLLDPVDGVNPVSERTEPPWKPKSPKKAAYTTSTMQSESSPLGIALSEGKWREGGKESDQRCRPPGDDDENPTSLCPLLPPIRLPGRRREPQKDGGMGFGIGIGGGRVGGRYLRQGRLPRPLPVDFRSVGRTRHVVAEAVSSTYYNNKNGFQSMSI